VDGLRVSATGVLTGTFRIDQRAQITADHGLGVRLAEPRHLGRDPGRSPVVLTAARE
jgi:hypothetical protein